jgi:hypothetical protein
LILLVSKIHRLSGFSPYDAAFDIGAVTPLSPRGYKISVAKLPSLRTSTDFPVPGWGISRSSIGLDFADRTVQEAEVLIWRILRQKSAILTRHSLNHKKRACSPNELGLEKEVHQKDG